MNDILYMQRCIELAQKAIGNTYPNPLVGSVIVHQNKIIGEGYHQKAGGPHAEVHAIQSVRNLGLLKESTLYVTLEPCAHFGKTPPCALKIIEMGIPRVVIGMLDPHDKVNGLGKKLLEDAGIEVVCGVLEEECRALNKRFLTIHQRQRPYVILKWAESNDGFLDKDFQPCTISSSLASQWVHNLRAQEHSILVGTQTALTDNPSLTTRKIFGRNPIRILFDFDLKVPISHKIFNAEAPTIVLNSIKESEEENIKWRIISKENAIPDTMNCLYLAQIHSVLVEGGAFTLQQFLNSGCWDEVYVIRNPSLNLLNGTLSPQLTVPPVNQFYLGDDEVLHFKNE
ncbi:MAG: bifunctional diaminohydroxyphosphoribosylaminopyrimidine deaminase/5-amino-6-(5-phosphoribosylamino)uracil reductase RibD [Bacteroidetes bacterium]|nr:bifunctional diaminohydroxyphosphoribosylaminopyrimidine deaminase/5-amino-6-(5-phosphoribosylamino)uracil reductase RibD [Bacteroidota bacterium]